MKYLPVIVFIVGFAMGQMSASVVDINPWALSAFVAGLGLALGYTARKEVTHQ